jgi:hypothetical protein
MPQSNLNLLGEKLAYVGIIILLLTFLVIVIFYIPANVFSVFFLILGFIVLGSGVVLYILTE